MRARLLLAWLVVGWLVEAGGPVARATGSSFAPPYYVPELPASEVVPAPDPFCQALLRGEPAPYRLMHGEFPLNPRIPSRFTRATFAVYAVDIENFTPWVGFEYQMGLTTVAVETYETLDTIAELMRFEVLPLTDFYQMFEILFFQRHGPAVRGLTPPQRLDLYRHSLRAGREVFDATVRDHIAFVAEQERRRGWPEAVFDSMRDVSERWKKFTTYAAVYEKLPSGAKGRRLGIIRDTPAWFEVNEFDGGTRRIGGVNGYPYSYFDPKLVPFHLNLGPWRGMSDLLILPEEHYTGQLFHRGFRAIGQMEFPVGAAPEGILKMRLGLGCLRSGGALALLPATNFAAFGDLFSVYIYSTQWGNGVPEEFLMNQQRVVLIADGEGSGENEGVPGAGQRLYESLGFRAGIGERTVKDGVRWTPMSATPGEIVAKLREIAVAPNGQRSERADRALRAFADLTNILKEAASNPAPTPRSEDTGSQ